MLQTIPRDEILITGVLCVVMESVFREVAYWHGCVEKRASCTYSVHHMKYLNLIQFRKVYHTHLTYTLH